MKALITGASSGIGRDMARILSEKGYTNEASKLVMSIIPYRKLPEIKTKIHAIDPLAFVIVYL